MKNLDISYLRVSTSNQRDNETIETQRYAFRRYFEQHRIKPEFQFEDDGVSGGVEIHKRPNGSELYRLVAEGRVKRLFVIALDRIGRDTIDTLIFLRLAENQGTQVIGISDGTDSNREGSTLETEIKAVISAQYRRDRTRQTKEGLRRRAAEGKISTRPPFGFVGVNGKLAIDEAKAEVMRKCFVSIACGARTRQLVQELNETFSPSPTGAGWRYDTLLYLLKHRAYIGEYSCFVTPKRRRGGGSRIARDPSEKITIECPAIISNEVFNAVQEKLAFNRRWCATSGKRLYLLKSVLRCGRCGLTYVGHAISGRRYRDKTYPEVRYYECGSLANKNYQFCGGARVNANRVESAIWQEIESFIESPSKVISQLVDRWNRAQDLAAKTSSQERKRISVAKSKHRAARERLIMSVAKGVMSDRDAQWGLQQLDKDTDALSHAEAALALVEAKEGAEQRQMMTAEAVLRSLRIKLDEGLTPEKKFQIVRHLIKSAVIQSASVGKIGKVAIAVEYVLTPPVCFAPGGFAFNASSRKK